MEDIRAAYRNLRKAHPDSKFEGWFSRRVTVTRETEFVRDDVFVYHPYDLRGAPRRCQQTKPPPHASLHVFITLYGISHISDGCPLWRLEYAPQVPSAPSNLVPSIRWSPIISLKNATLAHRVHRSAIDRFGIVPVVDQRKRKLTVCCWLSRRLLPRAL